MSKYKVKREGGDCLRCLLFLYSIIFWAANLVLIFLGLWTLLDPRQSYVIDLINFAEGSPTLKYAAYVSVFAGGWGLFIGFIIFCGAHTRVRTLLGWDTLFLALLFCAGIAMAALALSFRNEMAQELPTTLRQIVKRQYGVDHHLKKNEGVTKIVDKIQFYQQCCGSLGPSDYMGSLWMDHIRGSAAITDEVTEIDKKLVPVSCCTQIMGSSALNPLARSEARCQQIGATKNWRHSQNECCGGYNATDYKESFWYITNTIRGTVSYVPYSCCKQAQNAKYFNPVPIDHMCITYDYNSKAFASAVNTDGCHEKLQRVISDHAWIFAGIGIGYSAIMMVGICLTSLLCSRVHYFYYTHDDESEVLDSPGYH